MDLRAIVRAAAISLHGQEPGALAALARRVAPRWGLAPRRAEQKLSRWLNRAPGKGMSTEMLEALLDESKLDVVTRRIEPAEKIDTDRGAST